MKGDMGVAKDGFFVEGEPLLEMEVTTDTPYKDLVYSLLEDIGADWNGNGVKTWIEQKLREIE